MPTYFPFLRGKQNELIALRELAPRIANSGLICPIIEPVNTNATTRISFDSYVEAGMRFLFIANPRVGALLGRAEEIHREFSISGVLSEYDNYIPTLNIYRETAMPEIEQFACNYGTLFRAVIYRGEPISHEVRNWCVTHDRIYYHVILEGIVPADFVDNIPFARRVFLRDNFRRQVRNADYPTTEFFTDLNTAQGNPTGANWGDYSIVGDNYSDSGGPAYAVAIHHLHFSENGRALNVSHFLSDRTETIADLSGKTMEAIVNLVQNLPGMMPNDTRACEEYRRMVRSGDSKGLGYLKRLGILHHLELILANE